MSDKKSTGIYPPYFNTYVSLVENEETNSILQKQAEEAEHFFLQYREKNGYISMKKPSGQ